MRVGLVLTGGVDRSGRERVIPAILSLVERLARRHELHVFALHHSPMPCTYSLLGATVHDLGHANTLPGLRRREQLARLMAALELAGPFDLLHAYWALPAGSVTTAAAERLRVPCLLTADSGEWSALPDIAYGLQRRWRDRRSVAISMRRATRVTVCSQYMADLARAHAVTADIIPLGVPVATATSARPADGPPWRLLHVASINRVKDHSTLLGALAHLVTREPRVHLDVVGEDTMAGAIQQLANALGVDPQVTFHGFQPTGALAAFHARAHLHVVSSRHEAAGVVTLEAAAAGVPTVGTAVGYVADWAANGRAVAVPVGHPRALGDAIFELLQSPERRATIAAAARDWTIAHNADWTASQFDRLYRELAGAS